MHQFLRLVRYFGLVQRGQMDNRLTDISIHRALSIAMSLAYSFYQGPNNTCNAKSNNSKNDLGSHKDNNVSLQKHTQKKTMSTTYTPTEGIQASNEGSQTSA